MLADGVMAILIGLIAYQIIVHPAVPFDRFIDVFWAQALLYAMAWVAILYFNGAYRLRAHWTIAGESQTIIRSTVWLALIGTLILFLSNFHAGEGGWALLLFPLQGVATVALRVALRVGFMGVRQRGRNVRNLVILGTGPDAVSFAATVRDHSLLGVQVAGFLGDEPPAGQPPELYWGRIADLPKVTREQVVDEIAVCVRIEEWPQVQPLVQLAHDEGKLIRVPLHVPQLHTSERFVEDLDGTAVLSYANSPDELLGHALKRTLDLAVATAALIVLGPIMLGIAVLLRLRQGPGVIFRQARVGIHGRVFTIFKFRTMTADAEERYPELAALSFVSGPAFKMVDDPRITPMGRWLRRFSLDELPQIFNVFRGEMSIVGPRPAPPREVDEYDYWHRRRLSVKPGITGLWQVSARHDEDFDNRAALDLSYIERWSVWLDLAIIFRTIPAVFRRPGH